MHRSAVCSLWFLLAALTMSASVMADGKVFLRLGSVATIPDQAALMYWNDGIQTLAIETRFVGDGDAGAWVVPLPSEPISIEPATTGLFPTLRSSVVPRIDSSIRYAWVIGFSIVLVVVWALALSRVKLAAAAAIVGVVLLLIPTVGRSRSQPDLTESPHIEVIDRKIVGAFDTVVIRAWTGKDLIIWLRSNSLKYDSSLEPMADELVRDNWVFVVSRLIELTAPKPGVVRAPHPLVFRFPTERPVYPLRLTGVNNGRLDVDLFVFGDEQCTIPGWKTLQSRPLNARPHRPGQTPYPIGDEYPIVHEGLRALVGDARWLTRLRATLSPTDMRSDAYVRWRTPRVSGMTAKTNGAALSGSVAAGLCAALVISLGVLAPKQFAKIKVAQAATMVGIAGALLVYLLNPAHPVVRIDREQVFASRTLEGALRADMFHALDTDPSFVATRDWVRERAWSYIVRPVEEGEIDYSMLKEEDSPGNFIIRSNAQGLTEFVRFGAYGEEWAEEMSRPPK